MLIINLFVLSNGSLKSLPPLTEFTDFEGLLLSGLFIRVILIPVSAECLFDWYARLRNLILRIAQ